MAVSPVNGVGAVTKKLRGYDFFHAIGAPKRIVAPMVDQSELAFRMLTRKHGAELCYTPMFHSRLFAESPAYREKMFEQHIQDRPLIVQFCGNDPATVLAAAKHVEGHCDAVDLNLGCPQGIARKGRYGSFLMKEKDVVREIVQTLSDNLSIPVTVKIRMFPDEQETLEFCDMLQAAGCDMLVVHGRTKEMNKTLVREVNWDIIRQIKERLTIPVIANGGIEFPEDIERCLEATKADGVMTSEAILENPAILAETNNTPGKDTSFLELAKQYMEFAQQFPPANEKIVRAHLFKILFQDLRVHTDLRDLLAAVKTRAQMDDILKELEGRLRKEELDAPAGEKQWSKVVYAAETSWYRRHRKGQEKLRQRKDSYENVEESGFCNLFN
uniref:tRNA-dihydrouridine(16/17) synthase [NAD(P)(+)] n=1 Tax=Globisporangium ultimum (strain ATCC 200006 / CBS 805.95 / DAOM BR144) TaxID=431595 RepID=K3WW65_GLOUD